MLPKPRYLQLQQELCSSITLHKELIIDNPQDHLHVELFQRVAYNSTDRIIDLTEPINHQLRKTYGYHQQCQIYVYDPYVSDFRFLAFFPQQNSIILGQQFLQADTLLFRIKIVPELIKMDESENEMVAIDAFDNQQQQNNEAAGVEEKNKRRKTIKEMLQVIQQWRKLYLQYNSKLTIGEGAEMMGISKRLLEVYIHSVKLGEKYQYPFEQNLDKKIGELKKFLKQKNEQKKEQELEMFAKFKHLYK